MAPSVFDVGGDGDLNFDPGPEGTFMSRGEFELEIDSFYTALGENGELPGDEGEAGGDGELGELGKDGVVAGRQKDSEDKRLVVADLDTATRPQLDGKDVSQLDHSKECADRAPASENDLGHLMGDGEHVITDYDVSWYPTEGQNHDMFDAHTRHDSIADHEKLIPRIVVGSQLLTDNSILKFAHDESQSRTTALSAVSPGDLAEEDMPIFLPESKAQHQSRQVQSPLATCIEAEIRHDRLVRPAEQASFTTPTMTSAFTKERNSSEGRVSLYREMEPEEPPNFSNLRPLSPPKLAVTPSTSLEPRSARDQGQDLDDIRMTVHPKFTDSSVRTDALEDTDRTQVDAGAGVRGGSDVALDEAASSPRAGYGREGVKWMPVKVDGPSKTKAKRPRGRPRKNKPGVGEQVPESEGTSNNNIDEGPQLLVTNREDERALLSDAEASSKRKRIKQSPSGAGEAAARPLQVKKRRRDPFKVVTPELWATKASEGSVTKVPEPALSNEESGGPDMGSGPLSRDVEMPVRRNRGGIEAALRNQKEESRRTNVKQIGGKRKKGERDGEIKQDVDEEMDDFDARRHDEANEEMRDGSQAAQRSKANAAPSSAKPHTQRGKGAKEKFQPPRTLKKAKESLKEFDAQTMLEPAQAQRAQLQDTLAAPQPSVKKVVGGHLLGKREFSQLADAWNTEAAAQLSGQDTGRRTRRKAEEEAKKEAIEPNAGKAAKARRQQKKV